MRELIIELLNKSIEYLRSLHKTVGHPDSIEDKMLLENLKEVFAYTEDKRSNLHLFCNALSDYYKTEPNLILKDALGNDINSLLSPLFKGGLIDPLNEKGIDYEGWTKMPVIDILYLFDREDDINIFMAGEIDYLL